MRHQKKGRRLGRTSSHRKALFANMVTSLFRHETIETTTAKAKELRGVAEKMVTLGKEGTLHARRNAFRLIRDEGILKKLFDEIAPRFTMRPGGYTRVIKSGIRRGDRAPLSIIQLVESDAKEPVSAEQTAK